MAQYTVYADVLWGINFFLDFVLLFCTARFGNFPARLPRLLLAAVLGGIYGVCVLFPQLSALYLFGCKIGFSFLMLFVAFGRLPLRKFLRAVVYFYLISFAMAGAVMGGSSLIAQTPLAKYAATPVNLAALAFAVLAALLLARWGILHLRRNWQRESLTVPVEIWLGNRRACLSAFLDTGNDLTDPVSGKSVMVTEYAAVKDILPPRFCQLYERYAESDVVTLLEKCNATAATYRLRLIPFNSIGRENGMLLGIVPDMVVFRGNDEVMLRDLIVCLYHRPLARGKGYAAVVNPVVLTTSNRREQVWASGA